MKLLVVGAGSIGSRHAANAKALGVAAIGVTDSDRERRDALAGQLGARAFETVEDGLAWAPDAAIICTPPASHVSVAQLCASAGCHLLIEKPLAASAAGVSVLADTISARGLRCAVAYQLRFHPALARMRELVSSGAIGDLLSVQAEYGQYLPSWRPSRDYRQTYTAHAAMGGGILLDGSHEIDYVRWIGGEVAAVYAVAAKLSTLEMDGEDTAALLLRFRTPAIGEIHLDCVQRGYSRRCTLIGSEATVRWDVTSGLHITTARGVTHEAIVPAPNDPYVAELRAFIAGDLASHATLADGLRILEVVDAARASAASRSEIAL